MEDLRSFAVLFEAPEGVEEALAAMTTPEERRLLRGMADRDGFSPCEAASLLGGSSEEAEGLCAAAYRRGCLNRVPEQPELFRRGTLYSRLDLFAQFEPRTWLALPESLRRRLDDWYLDAYARRLVAGVEAKRLREMRRRLDLPPSEAPFLGNDVILPLGEALDYVRNASRQATLVPCNCRAIARNCSLPLDTCILYLDPEKVNTVVHRGWGRPLSREEAARVVRRAHEAGLMHSAGPDALCNCDGCCCYPARVGKRLHCVGLWPEAKYRVQWDDSRCVRCGRCVPRCPFQVFEVTRREEKRSMSFDSSRCRGCGLCVEVCPAGALRLGPRG
ncbi:4Fe-4S ferredoxin iron-sulfur binding domain protein [Aminomonas paucivorans DSM 12260]|uniref:4Fe-4S ferredoxin iron-sulfur binding domain protein n=1 Tax=Aminomonas paucivorans DSM 12260 TaxID=584708 RepID=E3CW52_9BACT|nr:4Fe-4S binding protein [Aminomonas paucivorans]EFQ22510.1 4Fe-4S ferredoxin iron-sulfur binding domain protein [Aminomonas paucivorans DSM 12260]